MKLESIELRNTGPFTDAVRIGPLTDGLNVLTALDIEAPGPGQVRVAVSHCGFCHSDLSVVNGSFRRLQSFSRNPKQLLAHVINRGLRSFLQALSVT